MAINRLVLVFVLLLGVVFGCGKEDKDSVKPSERNSKPGHALVAPPTKNLGNDEAIREWTKKGRHTPVPEPGHVLVK